MNDCTGILYSDSEFMDLTGTLILAPPVPVIGTWEAMRYLLSFAKSQSEISSRLNSCCIIITYAIRLGLRTQCTVCRVWATRGRGRRRLLVRGRRGLARERRLLDACRGRSGGRAGHHDDRAERERESRVADEATLEVGAFFGHHDGLIIRSCRVNRHLVDSGSRSATVSAF